MRLTFCGAAHEVTGSCYFFETDEQKQKDGSIIPGKKIVIDCGMFQGSDFNEGKNHDVFPFDPKTIDAVLVTHAHLDHTGRIPKMVREGFAGPIYMTKATAELSKLVWEDAYQIMSYHYRKFQEPILFDTADIARTVNQCVGLDYHEEMTLGQGVSAVWKDAGHIFGAAFIELAANGKNIVFSGDVGNANMPILKETEKMGNVDVLLCESTYGDRIHESAEERKRLLFSLLKEGIARGGTIMIPAFSIERTQELLYTLHMAIEHEKSLPSLPIFLDSPMAIDALAVYKKYPEYYDREAARMHMLNDDFLNFPGLRITRSQEESKQINHMRGPKIVIAGAGMMNGGRILHHARRYLSDPASTLLIVGYQSAGTLGRRIYEGAKRVSVYGDVIDVRCAVESIGGLSAHADQDKLVRWVGDAKKRPSQIYCVHGEAHAATALAQRFEDELDIKSEIPKIGDIVAL